MSPATRALSYLGVTAAAFAVGLIAGRRLVPGRAQRAAASAPAEETKWICGMHPDVIREEPGACPICGMDLVPKRVAGRGSKGGERKIAYWWDPMMGPSSISDRPGKSPMGMDLVPRYEDEVAGGQTIEIDPALVQNMGIRLATVEEGPLETSIRTVGTLREAQPLERDITLKIGGFVEELRADTVGMEVRSGDPLFVLYSPDLLVAQGELLAARRAVERLPATASEVLRRESEELLETARRKLRLWDIPEEEIRRFESFDRPDGRATFRSPAGGFLVEKEIVKGTAVMAGTRVLRIVDYSTLWLDGRAYEYQIPFLQLGQTGRARVESLPGDSFEGKVVFLAPSVDEKTRTATVRIAVPNPEGRLKPGMYARVEFRALVAERALRVPREAVIDTGTRQIAFVAREGGRFDPRLVRMGAAGDEGMVQVIEGLAPGEEVVVSGQFLLDSESRTREAIRKFKESKKRAPAEAETRPAELGAHQGMGPAPPPASAPSTPGTEAAHRRVDAVVLPYIRLVDALARDGYDAEAVETIRRGAEDLAREDRPEVGELGKRIAEQAKALASGPEAERRKRFAAMSESVVRLVGVVPPTGAVGEALFVLRCPMFPGSWLQPSREVTNPLYGTAMLHCGEVVRAIVPVRVGEAPVAPHAHEPR
ncbi:MAG TPA: efflux RND transporter periplasmic adaptor subunit [Planctomycetota bacterium]|jgi:multidrug efflux pump subunit AcrA (membrane-fusion protein)|nr:efflux RND transporter periplasmic adaptor subunit [Planctomycetota bacterium]